MQIYMQSIYQYGDKRIFIQSQFNSMRHSISLFSKMKFNVEKL